jgi:hypothetical protein
MPALASLEDVKRILRLTDDDPARDAQLRAALDAVESWAEDAITIREGPQVDVHLDVHEDATLFLPGGDVVVTLVRVFEYPGQVGQLLSPVDLEFGSGFDVQGDRLVLRPITTTEPFEGAVASRLLRTYARVEIFYEGTGVVPKRVTEGIAFLAAGYWRDGPRVLKGIKSERIGDYSYALDTGTSESSEEAPFVARALWLLKRDLRRGRVRVT